MYMIESYEELLEKSQNPLSLIFVSTVGCSVCHAVLPRVEEIVDRNNINAYHLKADQVPEAVGQLSLFTAPVVLIFQEGKEMHRQARFIDFEKLEQTIQLMTE